uniref:Uncharacterized protein n=1 Tax=Tanacetum cinerariifolium TaxID=118510 RepID=A0A6L2P680_TANCI|nr:hypothetical protein [Tanacetum cinerariifolium]
MMKQSIKPVQKVMKSTSMKIDPSLMMNYWEAEPLATIIPPTIEITLKTPAPQDKWSREKHISLVNILGEPMAGVTTRSRIRDSEAASAHECLYVNFLFEIESKKLLEDIHMTWTQFRKKWDNIAALHEVASKNCI